MASGNAFFAPQGWCSWRKDQTYHYLGRTKESASAVFAVFEIMRGAPHTHLAFLSNAQFEEGLVLGYIQKCNPQPELPPWLHGLEGKNLNVYDENPRRIAKALKLHSAGVDKRVALIYGAVENFHSIISDQNPERAANRFARECVPPQNETRFRTWLFSYIAFGNERNVLFPIIHNNGNWDRGDDTHGSKKFGRPSIYFGHRSGFSAATPEMIKKIKAAYLKYAHKGEGLEDIYAAAMPEVFECFLVEEVTVGGQSHKAYQQRQGLPFPTFAQFRYRVLKEFGADKVRGARIGPVRERSKHKPNMGRFSQSVVLLVEKASTDASYIMWHPMGVVDDQVMPKICVVKIVCNTSGAIVGIGFTNSTETDNAYKAALFCCAIDKTIWGRLFGLEIGPDDIPGMGLPANISSDRGPFMSQEITKILDSLHIGHDASPSRTPQSNATVESKHKKKVRIEGAPIYRKTKMTSNQLARSVILEIAKSNKSASAIDRATPDMINTLDVATPINIWKFLEERHRTAALPMTFETAVRTFLTPVTFSSRDGGLYLKGIRYDAPELLKTKIPSAIAHRDGLTFRGYALEMAVRYAWIEVDGRLVELSAMLPIRDDEDMLYMSTDELKQYAANKRRHQALHRDGQIMAKVETNIASVQNIGPVATTARVVTGKPKTKTAAVRSELDLSTHKPARKRQKAET